MANYGALKELILRNFMDRTDISGDAKTNMTDTTIENYIQEAIEFYQSEPFFFLETITTSLSATSGSDTITLPTDFVSELPGTFRLTGDDARILFRRQYNEIEEFRAEPGLVSTGTPNDYAIKAGSFHLFPEPDNTFPTSLTYIRELTVLVNDTDENAWTNEGRRLVTARATGDIWLYRFNRSDRAQVFYAKAQQEKDRLTHENMRRNKTDSNTFRFWI